MPVLECLFTQTSMRVLLRHYRHVWIGGMLVGKDQHAQASGRGKREGGETGRNICRIIKSKREGGETGGGMQEHDRERVWRKRTYSSSLELMELPLVCRARRNPGLLRRGVSLQHYVRREVVRSSGASSMRACRLDDDRKPSLSQAALA